MSLVKVLGIGRTKVEKDMQDIYHLDLEKTSYEDFRNGTINEDVILFRSEIVKLPDYSLKEVRGDFIARYSELESVENFPEHITGTLDISFTKIRSLQPVRDPDAHPTKMMRVDGDFVCTGCELKEDDVRSFCDVGGTIYC